MMSQYSINFSFSAVIRVCKFHQDWLLSKLMTVLKYKLYPEFYHSSALFYLVNEEHCIRITVLWTDSAKIM